MAKVALSTLGKIVIALFLILSFMMIVMRAVREAGVP